MRWQGILNIEYLTMCGRGILVNTQQCVLVVSRQTSFLAQYAAKRTLDGSEMAQKTIIPFPRVQSLKKTLTQLEQKLFVRNKGRIHS